MIEIPLSKRGKNKGKFVAIVDDEDKELMEINWNVKNRAGKQYARRKIPLATGGMQTYWLHRVVLERKIGRPLQVTEIADHINGDGLDNRRENLRVASFSQNQGNRKLNKNNKSGYKGVSLNTKTGKWEIKFSFDSREEAYEAYCLISEKKYGEFVNNG